MIVAKLCLCSFAILCSINRLTLKFLCLLDLNHFFIIRSVRTQIRTQLSITMQYTQPTHKPNGIPQRNATKMIVISEIRLFIGNLYNRALSSIDIVQSRSFKMSLVQSILHCCRVINNYCCVAIKGYKAICKDHVCTYYIYIHTYIRYIPYTTIEILT